MNKKIYLAIVLSLFMHLAFAQNPITLNALDNSTLVQKDTFMDIENYTNYTGWFKAETNHSWDFSSATYIPKRYALTTSENTSNDFPDAIYSGSFFRPFSGPLQFDIEIYTAVNNSIIENVGEAILTDQILPLQSLTGNPNDKLVFPKQAIPYQGTEIERYFPASMGDSWKSENASATNFNLTVEAYGLNSTPGVYKAFETVRDTVVGWGTVTIKNGTSGLVSEKVEVLQIRRSIVRRDSFFLGGSPAPKSLLDAFGLVQGRIETISECFFYRQGNLRPLVSLIYVKNAEFNTLASIEVHQDDFKAKAASVTNLDKQNKVHVYPNPATNYVTVDLPTEATLAWSYRITNLQGQIVQEDVFTNSNTIYFKEFNKNGIYLLEIRKEGNLHSISKITLNN